MTIDDLRDATPRPVVVQRPGQLVELRDGTTHRTPSGWWVYDLAAFRKAGPYPTLVQAHAYATSVARARLERAA